MLDRYDVFANSFIESDYNVTLPKEFRSSLVLDWAFDWIWAWEEEYRISAGLTRYAEAPGCWEVRYVRPI